MTDINHEAFVAGALLMSPESTLRDCRGILTPESFENSIYGGIYAAALELEAEGLAMDVAVVKERCNRNGIELTNEDCIELMRGVPTLTTLEFYAERVAQAADGRNLRNLFLDASDRLGRGDNAHDRFHIVHVKCRNGISALLCHG